MHALDSARVTENFCVSLHEETPKSPLSSEMPLWEPGGNPSYFAITVSSHLFSPLLFLLSLAFPFLSVSLRVAQADHKPVIFLSQPPKRWGLPVCCTVPVPLLGDWMALSHQIMWSETMAVVGWPTTRGRSVCTVAPKLKQHVTWYSLPSHVVGMYLCSYWWFWLMFARLCSFFIRSHLGLKGGGGRSWIADLVSIIESFLLSFSFFLFFLMAVPSRRFLSARSIFEMIVFLPRLKPCPAI